MKPKTAIICSLALLFCACSGYKTASVSGKISNGANKSVKIALQTFGGTEVVGYSELPADGSFSFKIRKDDDRFSQLETSPIILKLFIDEDDCITTILCMNDDIKLTADAGNMSKSYSISGGEEAVLKHSLDSALLTFINSVDTLYAIYEKNIENDSIREEIESDYLLIVEKHRLYLEDFIEKHPYHIASYFAFFQSYNRREFFDKNKDIGILGKINLNLSEKYPESEYVKSMISYENDIKNNTVTIKSPEQ